MNEEKIVLDWPEKLLVSAGIILLISILLYIRAIYALMPLPEPIQIGNPGYYADPIKPLPEVKIDWNDAMKDFKMSPRCAVYNPNNQDQALSDAAFKSQCIEYFGPDFPTPVKIEPEKVHPVADDAFEISYPATKKEIEACKNHFLHNKNNVFTKTGVKEICESYRK